MGAQSSTPKFDHIALGINNTCIQQEPTSFSVMHSHQFSLSSSFSHALSLEHSLLPYHMRHQSQEKALPGRYSGSFSKEIEGIFVNSNFSSDRIDIRSCIPFSDNFMSTMVVRAYPDLSLGMLSEYSNRFFNHELNVSTENNFSTVLYKNSLLLSPFKWFSVGFSTVSNLMTGLLNLEAISAIQTQKVLIGMYLSPNHWTISASRHITDYSTIGIMATKRNPNPGSILVGYKLLLGSSLVSASFSSGLVACGKIEKQISEKLSMSVSLGLDHPQSNYTLSIALQLNTK